MAIDVPNLDDRTFEDLFLEARSRIPRYAPEWTDHNESDPGIALLQLQAWLTEALIYRLNQVPERHYRKFLQLIGIQVKPASPAEVDVTFTTALPAADVVVPSGTQVATAGGGGDPPVTFELEQGFVAVGPRLDAVQVFDGAAYRDVSTANAAPGQGLDPFGPHARPGSALLLGFAAPGPFTANAITLKLYAAQPLASPVVEAQLDAAPVPPPARLAYEYWDGVAWEPVASSVDETWALLRSGRLQLAVPPGRAAKAKVGEVADARYWLRVRLLEADFDRIPRLEQVLANTVTVRQLTTLRDEVLGGSDGMPDQGPFRLSTRPVLGGLALEIDEGSGFEAWRAVDDLAASGPDARHYVLDHAAGEITFGNGRHGRIPAANVANPAGNVVARRYQAGGGARGNVGAGTVTVLQSALTGIQGVANARPAAGGADTESVEDAKWRAPSALKARGRAVTAEDFVTLTLETPAPVARAQALPLHHPRFPDAAVAGAVTVIVVPDAPGRAPRPSEATLGLVCRQLNRHRLVTTEVFAVGPTYRRVRVSADIVVRGDRDLAAVRDALAAALLAWMHPLHGGDDGKGWPFGGTIYASSLYRVALGVDGVDRIRDNQLLVELDGEPQLFCRDVPLSRGDLVEALDPELTVAYR